MKKLQIIGNLVKDSELFKTKEGKDYVRFTVACHEFTGGMEKTDFIDVFSFDPYIVGNAQTRLTKGRKVFVMGDMDHNLRVKDGKAWINFRISADIVEFPNGFSKKEEEASGNTEKKETGQVPSTAKTNNQQSYTAVTEAVRAVETPPDNVPPYDEDLPF